MLNETGAREAEARLPDAAIGAVNLSEVVSKLQARGIPDDLIAESLMELDLLVIAFDEAQALAAGKLRRQTRSGGLSLGDRACLALAITLGATAITADRAWSGLDLPVAVEIVR
jgi:PIN domain nuclease of toxin-antitoxin system